MAPVRPKETMGGALGNVAEHWYGWLWAADGFANHAAGVSQAAVDCSCPIGGGRGADFNSGYMPGAPRFAGEWFTHRRQTGTGFPDPHAVRLHETAPRGRIAIGRSPRWVEMTVRRFDRRKKKKT